MLKRPKRQDNEEDLLYFQEQFELQKSSPAAKVVRMTPEADNKKRDVVSLDKQDAASEHRQNAPCKIPSLKERLDRSTRFEASEMDHPVSGNVDASELLDHHDRHITAVLTKIKERDAKVPVFAQQNQFIGGFPAAPHIKKEFVSEDKNKDGKKRSLFARQFRDQSPAIFGLMQPVPQPAQTSVAKEISPCEERFTEKNAANVLSDRSNVITGEGLGLGFNEDEKRRIHQENMSRLSELSTKDILQEQAKLKSSLDPKILAFIAAKREKAAQPNTETNEEEMKVEDTSRDVAHQNIEMKATKEVNEEADFDPHKEFMITKDIPGMEIIEDEKLKWMKEPPKPLFKNDKEQTGVAARFDLDGNLASRTAESPFDRALHHHGEDPDAPGYTLEELFHLARCNFKQQRVFALQLLARILEQFHKGRFHDHLQTCLLTQLLDAGLPFLLRWSLDENTEAIFSAAVYAFSAMLTVPCDDDAIDKLLYMDQGFEIPCLRPEIIDTKHIDEDEKRDLTDPEMMATDVIRGLVQMQILPRLRYILEVCKPSDTTVNNCMAILTRVVLHSTESAYEVMKCPRLIETICSNFLPITWIKEESTGNYAPFYSAARLVRFLCISGRNIASKLWVDFDVCSRVLRYVSLLRNREGYCDSVIVESLHIWRICLSYGIACSTTRDVYPLIISLLQKFASKTSEEAPVVLPALVLLAEAIVQATSIKTQEINKDNTDKSGGKSVRFSGVASDDIVLLEWSVVAGIHSIAAQLMKENLEMFLSENKTDGNHRVLSCLLLYFSAYVNNAKLQNSLNKVDALSEIESLMNDFVAKLIHSDRFLHILADMRLSSDLVRESNSLHAEERVASLPSYGMSIFKDGSTSVGNQSSFILVNAATKLLWSITEFHKGCGAKVFDYVTSNGVLEYLKEFCSSTVSTRVSSTAISSSLERSYLYHLIKLFKNSAYFVGLEKTKKSVIKTYHLACLKLFGILQNGEEFQAKELLADVIFQRAFFPENQDVTALTARIGELKLSSSATEEAGGPQSINRLLNVALENLPYIGNTYATVCFKKLKRKIAQSKNKYSRDGSKIESFFLPPKYGTLMPVDWIFQPIIELYHMATNVELSGQVISQLSADSVKTLEKTLLFSLMLEIWRPEYFVSLPPAIRLVRLLCVFLIGNDAFLESPIYQLLETFSKIFTSNKMLEKLDFEMKFPGISSFYDLYNSLLIQFSASSFGDPVFSNFLLIPLQQKYNCQFRKAVWTEGANILRVFPLPIKSVAIKLENFIEPQEQDEELLRLYLKNLSDGSARPSWCPFFYMIAIHHLSSFIFSMTDMQDFSIIQVRKTRMDVLHQVINLKNKDVKMDIIMFDKIDLDIQKGFKTFESLPTLRQIMIERAAQVES